MKDIFPFRLRWRLPSLLALLIASSLQAQQASAGNDPFVSATSLNAVLDRPWNRQTYLAAYIKDYDQPDWPAFSKQLREQKKWGRNDIWDLQPYAMLYRVTGERKYSQAVQSALLALAEHPPADLTFSLSAVCYLFEKVRGDLSAPERAKIEASIAACADAAMKGEKGTAMNRGLLNAFGLAYAARVLPDDPRHSVWDDAQRSMFARDFERIQDTNEDSTNYHFVFGEALVRYIQLSEKDPAKFYAQPYVKALFERWLGLATPFGGFPIFGKARWHYPELSEVYEAAAAGLHDGRFRWLAQRILNYARANGQKMPNTPILDFLDDSIMPVAPSGSSFFNDRRMGQPVADKLVVRTGLGPADTYVAYNLLNEGGHGTEDATALITLIDGYTPLLVNPFDYDSETEQNKNLLLFRRASEDFPFSNIGPTNDPEWRRVIRPIRFQHTAIGGPNIDFQNITSLGLRIESVKTGKILVDDIRLIGPKGDKLVADFESPGILPKGTALSDDAIQGKHSLAVPIQEKMPLPWLSPTDVSDYDALQYWYRFTPLPSAPGRFQTKIESPGATGYWGFFDTYRDTHLRFLRDDPGFHAASLDILAKPYFGGTLHQFRDTLVLPGRLVWVRDTVQPLEAGELQFGPLWHVNQVLNQGGDWLQATQAPFEGAARGHDAVWKFPPRNLLIRVLAQQLGSGTSIEKNPADASGHRTTIFGHWKGLAKPGTTYAFDSFLIPNETSAAGAPELAGQVKIIAATPEWTVIQLGDDYLVANPLGRTVKAGAIETDCLALHLQVADGHLVTAQGVQGKFAVFAGVEVHRSGQVSDFPHQ